LFKVRINTMSTSLKIIIAVTALLTSITLFELVQQNSELRDAIQTLEQTMPRIDELARRRDAADKEIAALRAKVAELDKSSASGSRGAEGGSAVP
jgi:chromosome segregation ATPase